MKITSTEFIISAAGPKQFPEDGLPEIALAGRSNVGKSSLINNMIQRKNLARTSSQPGKTQTLNYYRIGVDQTAFYFVDFPGYGYAKVSKTRRMEWGKMAEQYLETRTPLKQVLQVIDFRHPPTADDCAMHEWLRYHDIPLAIVTTKIDKVPRSKWARHLKELKAALELDGQTPVIPYSSETGQGRDELWKLIEPLLEPAVAVDEAAAAVEEQA